MKKLLSILATYILVAGSSLMPATLLDTQVWGIPSTARLGGSNTNCISSNNVAVTPGQLTLSAIWTPSFTCTDGNGGSSSVNLVTGTVYTRNFTFGVDSKGNGVTMRIDVRAKLAGLGVHNTIWLLGVPCRSTFYVFVPNCPTFSTPPTAEIDIAEARPASTGDTVTLRQNLLSSSNIINTTVVTDYTQNFHVYSVVYTIGSSVTWLVDNVQTNTTSTAVPSTGFLFSIDQESDAAGGIPASNLYPQTTTVTYVRACTATGSPCAPGTAASGVVFDEEFASSTYSTFQGFTP